MLQGQWAFGSTLSPAPAWDPTQFGTVVSRWDFSNRLTTYQGTGGSGSLASANGDPVGSVADLIGGKLLAAVTTLPVLRPGVQNGLNVCEFDGVANQLVNGSFPAARPVTVLIVYKSLVVPAGPNGLIFNGSTSATRQGFGCDTDPLTFLTGQSNLVSYANTVCNGVFGQVTGIWGPGSSALYLDGNQIGATGGADTVDWTVFSIGGNKAGTSFSNVQVGEVVVYSLLNDQAGAQSAMKARWRTP